MPFGILGNVTSAGRCGNPWRQIALIGCCWCLAAHAASAQSHTIELRALSRSGGQTGNRFTVAASVGTNLDEITSLHFSHPGIKAELETADPLPHSEERQRRYGRFVVDVPAELPTGRYEVRARGRHGISNPRAFLITPLVHEPPKGISHDRNAPTTLPPNTVLHAKTTAAEIDYFGLSVHKSQSLRVDLYAQRVDSRLIAQLKLYDASGRQLATARGADDVDPLLQTGELPAGDYLLAVHDFTFRGGDEYHYQLVAQDLAESDWKLEDQPIGEGRLPWPSLTRGFTIKEPAFAANPPESNKTETIQLPADETRWFSDQNKESLFEFSANQGDAYCIDVVSERVGQPSDARLIVQRLEPQASAPPKLHDVLNVDDSQGISDGAVNLFSKDPVALFTAPATADYRITLRDLDQGVSLAARQRYRLRIRPLNPGFDLIGYRVYPHRDVNQTKPLGSKLFRGGSETIRVLAVRRDGWTGPIRITAEQLPDGVTASEGVIAANQRQTQITLTAAEDAPSSTAPIRLVGFSEDRKQTAEVVPATVTWGKGSGRDFIRSRRASQFWVAVSDQDLAPLSIVLGDQTVPEVKKGSSLKLPVKLARREGGKAACVLRARDLPPGVTMADVNIPAEKAEGTCEFKISTKAAPGTYSLWLQSETKIKVKPNPQVLARAQAYRSHLQTLHDDPAQASNLESIKSAIAAADKQVEAAKAAAKDQELTVFLPTSNATIRVVDP